MSVMADSFALQANLDIWLYMACGNYNEFDTGNYVKHFEHAH